MAYLYERAVIAAASFMIATSVQAAPMLGFTQPGADAQRALEAKFDAQLSPAEIRARVQSMAAEPNHVGSPHDKANAEATLALFKSWGWDAHIETFSVLYPTPKEVLLELTGPEPFKATLTEVPLDATSGRTANALPAYVAYQGDGDVTAPLVYVNYGMPDDYKALARMGIDVRGKIVIARYGGGWRGLKPKLAQEHGAVGAIIYSDPADDGYGPGDTYPKGAFRPPTGFQRGSVMDLPVRVGDPLTPGYGAVDGAPRIPQAQAETILKIPALPISYGDAQHLLASLTGPVAPRNWRGALPITYKAGPSSAPVHLVVRSDWTQKPVYDVIATIKGSTDPDQWVVRGNHRDGWVYGAQDPLSGHSAMLEEAKALGLLRKGGWKPRRTIVYASWDGEEPGLLGSTEWAEAHAAELQAKAVLYINTDGNNRGFLSAQSSYSARRLLDQVAADVRDPETGVSVRDRAIAALSVRALAADATEDTKKRAKEAAAGGDAPVGDLGSGSDYTPFVQHLGVASINLGYGGEGDTDGVYHSAYDTFEHYSRFGDPGFAYGVALAQTGGRLVMRAADADLAPYQFGNLAAAVSGQIDEIKKLTDTMRERTAAQTKLLDAKAFSLAADPTLTNVPPEREDAVPTFDFKPLEDAAARLKASAEAYDAAAAAGAAEPAQVKAANLILLSVEQRLTADAGLPGRPWYKHLISAPGMLTGYGAKTLPGVREAIESRRWDEARAYVATTAAALIAAAARIDQATAALKG